MISLLIRYRTICTCGPEKKNASVGQKEAARVWERSGRRRPGGKACFHCLVSVDATRVSKDASNATCISRYVKQSPTADLGISSRHYQPRM